MNPNTKLRILMLLDGEFPNDPRVEKEAISLVKAGFEVVVACPAFNRKPAKETFQGIEVIRRKPIPFYKKFRAAALTLPFFYLYWKKFTRKLFQENKYDVIHAHDLIQGPTAVWASSRYDVPFVIDFHENYPYMLEEEPFTKGLIGKMLVPIHLWIALEKRVMNLTKYFISVAQEMKDRLLGLNPYAIGFVIENTLNPEEWPSPFLLKKPSSEEKSIKLIYVGGISPMRGLEIAIKGVYEANLENSDFIFKLDIYGDGKPAYLQFLNDLISELQLEELVLLKGKINLPLMGNALEDYDIGVVPHLKSVQTDYSSPNKLYQYLFYGLPVLSSDCKSLARVVEESNAGLIYMHNDPKDFSKKLSELVLRIKKDQYTSVSIHEIISTRYQWQFSEDELHRLYQLLSKEAEAGSK